MKGFGTNKRYGATTTQIGRVNLFFHHSNNDHDTPSQTATSRKSSFSASGTKFIMRKTNNNASRQYQASMRRTESSERRDGPLCSSVHSSSRDQPEQEETGFELHRTCNRKGEFITVARAEKDLLNSPPPLQTRRAKLKRFFFQRRKKMDVVAIVDKVDNDQPSLHRLPRKSASITAQIDDSLWTELFEAAQILVSQFFIVGDDSEEKRIESEEEVDGAIHKFRQHAERLGVQERELVRAVQDDNRSVRTGFVADDGTIRTSTTGFPTSAFSEDDGTIVTSTTGFPTSAFSEDDDDNSVTSFSTRRTSTDHTLAMQREPEDEMTTYSQHRNNHPVMTKLLDVFDYYFAAY